MNRYLVFDAQGASRVGPFGAWWAWLTPADHRDVPVGRARAWNAAAAAFVAGAVYVAARVGHLAFLVVAIVGMVAAAAVAIIAIERRIGGPFRRSHNQGADVIELAPGEPATAREAA